MVQSREGCAAQLDSFADMLCHVTRDLDASIFTDPPLAKRLRSISKGRDPDAEFRFFVDEHGRYEIHVTVKSEKGKLYPNQKSGAELYQYVLREGCARLRTERQVLGQEYETIVCVEGPGYYVLQGVAKMGKTDKRYLVTVFFMKTLPGGKEAAILSDGMGSGERALQESGMLVEMLEELLGAGFPVETALSMINTALCYGTGRGSLFYG